MSQENDENDRPPPAGEEALTGRTCPLRLYQSVRKVEFLCRDREGIWPDCVRFERCWGRRRDNP